MVEALQYTLKGREFDSRWGHWNFLSNYSFRPLYGPGVDYASNRNEYQGYFLEVKAEFWRSSTSKTTSDCTGIVVAIGTGSTMLLLTVMAVEQPNVIA